MRILHSWLSDIVSQGAPGWSVDIDTLDAGFVSVGLEVEGTPDKLPEISGPIVIGRVSTIKELEGFKKPIRFCLVDVGADEKQQIVCGARNFSEGDAVVVALPGCVLPGGFEIAERKTYGERSEGMICAASELGLGNDHSGIIVLEDSLAEPGDDARKVLGLSDAVIELNVTPDRGYCLSARGLGRELACGFDLDFVDPVETISASALAASGEEAWPLEVSENAGASRFALRRVTGIDATALTPWWIRRRLLTSGIRPISVAVDITNYVMLELGHPMHAFDAQSICGAVVVRRARAGEKLRTLDGIERTLDEEDVVICDDRGPISLAGVMGGAETEVTSKTTDVLLEAAVWAPLNVFRTGRRHKLGSEAAKRYERAVDAGATLAALDRAAALLAEIAGGSIEAGRNDHGGVPIFPAVTMRQSLPGEVAGVSYSPEIVQRRLRQVGCIVTIAVDDPAVLTVQPPSWRPDLGQPADLVEEVLRLEGLEDIPSVLPCAPAGRGLTETQRARRSVGRALASAGYVEVLSQPFVDPGFAELWNLAENDERRKRMTVLNPLDSDKPALATTLLPSLCEIAQRNVSRGSRDLALYAVAQVAIKTPNTAPVDALPVDRRPSDDDIARVRQSLPHQPHHVAIVLSGQRDPAGIWGPGRAVDASDAIEAGRLICTTVGITPEISAADHAPWHPGRCAKFSIDGRVIGYAGELHPAVLDRVGLPARTAALEFDLEAAGTTQVLPAPHISAFPPVLQDVALVVDAAVPAQKVADALRSGAGELLEDVRLFDVFRGEQIGDGKVSLGFALRFRATDRTLTEDEASLARSAAVAAATQAVGAVQRA